MSKGPKYRILSEIDFNTCRAEIADSLNSFCNKWCKREHADSSALSYWKKTNIQTLVYPSIKET
jgi:hypothetical protein